MRRLAVGFVVLFITLPAFSQSSSPAQAETKPSATLFDPAAIQQFIEKQFGVGYKLLPEYPGFTADLDGDGTPDLVLVAHDDNPLVNAVEYHYKVIDPYDSFYGFGDPRVTGGFNNQDPRNTGMVVLIIHAAKGERWDAATPKAKFVVINLPFTKISATQVVAHKKKTIGAVAAEETDMVSSVIFWDGKKYKYRPNGAASE
jgi:hypothetical protein